MNRNIWKQLRKARNCIQVVILLLETEIKLSSLKCAEVNKGQLQFSYQLIDFESLLKTLARGLAEMNSFRYDGNYEFLFHFVYLGSTILFSLFSTWFVELFIKRFSRKALKFICISCLIYWFPKQLNLLTKFLQTTFTIPKLKTEFYYFSIAFQTFLSKTSQNNEQHNKSGWT